MVDPARLAALLRRITDEVGAIERLAALDDDELFGDPDRLPAMKYRFVVAIEAAIDAGQHIVASEDLTPPSTFAGVFASLVEGGVIDADLGGSAQDMARFRNLLVHGYADIDDRRVVEIARTRLDDLRNVASTLASLVDE